MVDAALLEREWHDARCGNAAALEATLSCLLPVVQHAVRCRLRRIGSPADVVEDLTQEVLYKVSQGLRRCRAHSAPQIIAWVHVIAQRCALDLLRGPNIPVRFGAILVDDAYLESVWSTYDDESAGDPAIVRLCAIAVESQRVLSPQATQLLWHRLVEGVSAGDLGRRFGVREGAIKRRVHRAIASVRRQVRRRVGLLPDAERAQLLPLLQRWES